MLSDSDVIHKGCGGSVVNDHTVRPYEYHREDGLIEFVPPVKCVLCRKEIESDAELEVRERP